MLLVACGGRRLPEVDLSDPRLTAESRRLMADAEDELAIALARWEDAEAVLERERAWRKTLDERLADADGGLRKALGEVADARVRTARQAVEVAEARHGVAVARLARTRADTLMRHDLAMVELEPLTREVQRAREAVAEAERALADTRAEAEALADAAWTRWRELSSGGEPPLTLFIP